MAGVLSLYDLQFLRECRVFLHMLSWRDGYYWKAKERRESGEDKLEFEQPLKQEWLEFERRFGKKKSCP